MKGDGYAGFSSLFADDAKSGHPRLTEVACWAHARRAIYEVYDSNGSPLARGALDRIAELFEIETRINGCAPQERLAVGQQEAVPLLTKLETYLNNALSQISGKSTLAKAIRYALSRWTALTRCTTGGRLEMTTNAVERAIRPLAMTAKLLTSAICFSVKGLTFMRRIKIAPIAFPSRSKGVASVVLCPSCLA